MMRVHRSSAVVGGFANPIMFTAEGVSVGDTIVLRESLVLDYFARTPLNLLVCF
jgi:hypothetical protein